MVLGALATLGEITYFVHEVIEPAYTIGSHVATANDCVREAVQAGKQRIRDMELFRLGPEVFNVFDEWSGKYRESSIDLDQNKTTI